MLINCTSCNVLTMFFGRTIGKKIVGIKVVSIDDKKAKPHQILIRYVTKYVLYFEIYYVVFSMDNLGLLGDMGIFISIMMLVTVFFIYFRTLISIINKKPLVYELLSKTKHISTIKLKKKEQETDGE